MPALAEYSRNHMKGPSLYLDLEKAHQLLSQFQETARYRNWNLLAVAIMPNHVHLVVGVSGDPEPEKIRGDFKAYGSRALNQKWGKPVNGTWWTEGGSNRKLPDEKAVLRAIEYVKNQPNPLLIWINNDFQAGRAEGVSPPVHHAPPDKDPAPEG